MDRWNLNQNLFESMTNRHGANAFKEGNATSKVQMSFHLNFETQPDQNEHFLAVLEKC